MHQLWVCAFAILAAFISLAQARCYEDNCYRAMFPCRTASAAAYTSATQYCDTRTFEGSTATDYPAHATAACGGSQSKIFSACVCGPLCNPQQGPCSPAPTPSGALFYDSLDCQLPSVDQIDAPARFAILDGGYNRRAFKTWLGGVEGWNSSFPVRVHYKNIAVVKDRPTKISLKVQFLGADSGSIMIEADEDRVKQFFFAPLESGIWSDVVVPFIPSSDNLTFAVNFGFSSGNAWIKIDDVMVEYDD